MIKNISNDNILVNNSITCNNILSKAKGLMFSKKLQDKALIFKFNKEKTISLHMFFVFYPIDVIFLNEYKEVVDFKQNFRPFTFYSSKSKAKFALEMPSGTISKAKINIYDKIEF